MSLDNDITMKNNPCLPHHDDKITTATATDDDVVVEALRNQCYVMLNIFTCGCCYINPIQTCLWGLGALMHPSCWSQMQLSLEWSTKKFEAEEQFCAVVTKMLSKRHLKHMNVTLTHKPCSLKDAEEIATIHGCPLHTKKCQTSLTWFNQDVFS